MSKACTTIKLKVCQVPPPQKDTKSSRETHIISTRTHKTHIYYHNSRRDLHLVEIMCYNHSTLTQSRRVLCTTTTISTIHSQMTAEISTSIMISTRIMHEMHMISMHLHIDIMHDIISLHTISTRHPYDRPETPCTCYTRHYVL